MLASMPEVPTQSQDTMTIQLHDDQGLLDIVTTFARTGATMTRLHFDDQTATVIYHARPFVRRRMPSLISSLVSVLNVECQLQDTEIESPS